MSQPVVHLVDDDVSFLRALERMLKRSGLHVQTHGSAKAFLAQLGADVPGCVVADLDMPGMNGLQLQEAILARGNAMPVVFLTGQGEIPDSVRAMRRGAEDFLTKHAPREHLLDAIRRALQRDVDERARRNEYDGLRERFSTLSPRELEVLQHVVLGKLNKQIAEDLAIHERTVKLHRTAITTKLGVPSVAEITKLWIAAGRPGSDQQPI